MDGTRSTYYGGYGETKGERKRHQATLGAGIGGEIHFWILNWSLMMGYAGTGRVTDYTYWGDVYNPISEEPEFMFTPSIETALYLNFGGI
ncbi:hypothetical protein ACFL5V_02385 [Fibrobacterota bacterium]